MQELPEAPDKKKGYACTKKEPSRPKKETLSFFSRDWQSDNTKIFFIAGGRLHGSVFRRHAGQPFH